MQGGPEAAPGGVQSRFTLPGAPKASPHGKAPKYEEKGKTSQNSLVLFSALRRPDRVGVLVVSELKITVNSKVAVIGVGENNMFGHPSSVVLERLQVFRYTDF